MKNKKTRYVIQVKLVGVDFWLEMINEKYRFMTFACLEMIRLQGLFPEHEYKVMLTV